MKNRYELLVINGQPGVYDTETQMIAGFMGRENAQRCADGLNSGKYVPRLFYWETVKEYLDIVIVHTQMIRETRKD